MYIDINIDNSRKCTDVVFIILYCLLTLIVLSAFFYSFILEKEKNILKPRDPDGNMCD